MILDEILEKKRHLVAEQKERVKVEILERAASQQPASRSFLGRLRATSPIACIAEFKRRSPSQGWIREDADPAAWAVAYEEGGASAMSVLTDEPFFGGRLEDLRAAKRASSLPVLRKDFIVDRYQVVEAAAAEADAVLLIVAALDDDELSGLLAEARRHSLDALVETHDEAEIERALRAGGEIIGINHRDLKTFEVDTSLSARLRGKIPRTKLVVAESGIRTRADVRRLRERGVEAILVGETLMRADDPRNALREILLP